MLFRFNRFFRGLITAQSPRLKTKSSQGDSLRDCGGFGGSFLSYCFKVINLYGPYAEQPSFWEGLISSSLMGGSNLIVGGDLNFMLSLREFWGESPHKDPQELFFSNWICKNCMVDLEPLKLSHTWSNGRRGAHFVAKH
jgi:hypothetical protein